MMDDSDMQLAIEKAKEAIRDIYSNENLSNVEVEELEFDSENWLITVGFTRPKTRTTLGGLTLPLRQLKRVKIDRGNFAFNGMVNPPKR